MTYEDIIQSIADCLAGSDGDYIAEVYNNICSVPIMYVGGSVWEEEDEGYAAHASLGGAS